MTEYTHTPIGIPRSPGWRRHRNKHQLKKLPVYADIPTIGRLICMSVVILVGMVERGLTYVAASMVKWLLHLPLTLQRMGYNQCMSQCTADTSPAL